MVDPGAAQAIVRQLNRWYRKRAKPHGSIDHFYRGTRMSYTTTYRMVMGFASAFLLAVAAVLYFAPSVTEGKSPTTVLLLKLGWAGLVVLAIVMVIQAFRECCIITDDGVIKSNPFSRETRLDWKDIARFVVKTDDNQVILRTSGKAKLNMSLSYDGWRDFLDVASRRMDPELYGQFSYTLANLDVKRPRAATPRKKGWAKWFSLPRRS